MNVLSLIIAAVLLVPLVALLNAAILGGALMLLLGILYGEFGWLKPIGFLPSLGIAFAVSVLITQMKSDVD